MNRAQRPQNVVLAVHLPRSPSSWSKDDREWFEANRDRSHRVRPRLPDEWFVRPGDAENRDLLVAVRQVEPGMRLRVPFELPPSPWLARFRAAAATEAGAHALFDLPQQGETELSGAAVEAWLERYAQGGPA